MSTTIVAATEENRSMPTKIHLEQSYPHPRAKLWRALTEPALMAKWGMRPEGFAPVVGTRFKLVADKAQGWRGFVECEVLEVVPERLLRISWVGDEKDPPQTVSYALSDDGAGSRLTLNHEGFVGLGGFVVSRLFMGPGWKKMLKKKNRRRARRCRVKETTVATLNPGKGKRGSRIDAARYEAMKAAILAVVPRDADGITFASLPALVEAQIKTAAFAGASIPWYATTVKLDLEARGLIERISGRTPQRLRRP